VEFSIIVPTYNRAGFLPRLIKSVLNQTNRNFELIIVDDGSTDETKEVVDGYSDQRIKYYYTENQERSAARNFGIGKSNGRFVCFLDSDDELKSGHLECLEEAIQLHPSIHVFRTQYEFVNRDGTRRTSAFSAKVPNPGDIWRNFYPVASYCMRRNVAERTGWPEKFWMWEDRHFFLRVVLEYEIAELPCLTTIIHDHASRSVHEVDPERFSQKIWVIEHAVLDLWDSHAERLGRFISKAEMTDWIHDSLRGAAYDAIDAKHPELAREALSAARKYVRLATMPSWVYARLKLVLK